MLQNTLILIRYKDWLKNLIIIIPIIFSNNLKNYELYPNIIICFVVFCLASSIIYIINDIKDIKDDKSHSEKIHYKPIANGSISVKFAYLFILILIFFLTIVIYYFLSVIIYHIIFYLILNLLYIFKIKEVSYIDILLISLGYIIRIDAGSIIIDVDSTLLILLCTFIISIFFLSLKRLCEINYIQLNNIHLITRKSLNGYSKNILKNISISCIFILTFLIFIYIYLINFNLLFISPFFIIFLIRYNYLCYKGTHGERPISFVLGDKYLFGLILLSAFLSIYIFI